jgi:hypothetical protein
MKTIGLRELTQKATDHAYGILDKQDDGAFWGNDYESDEFQNTPNDVIARARRIVMNRLRGFPEGSGRS